MFLNLFLQRRWTVTDERTKNFVKIGDLLTEVDGGAEAHYDHFQLTFSQKDLLLILMLKVLPHHAPSKRVMCQNSFPMTIHCVYWCCDVLDHLPFFSLQVLPLFVIRGDVYVLLHAFALLVLSLSEINQGQFVGFHFNLNK